MSEAKEQPPVLVTEAELLRFDEQGQQMLLASAVSREPLRVPVRAYEAVARLGRQRRGCCD